MMCWPASQTFCPDLDAYVRRKCPLRPGQVHATLPRQGLGHDFSGVGRLGVGPASPDWHFPFVSKPSPGKKENSRNGSFPLSSFWKLFINCLKLFVKCLKPFTRCLKLFIKSLKLFIKCLKLFKNNPPSKSVFCYGR